MDNLNQTTAVPQSEQLPPPNNSKRNLILLIFLFFVLFMALIGEITFLIKGTKKQAERITSSPVLPTTEATLPPTGTFVEDQIVVKYKSEQSPDQLKDKAKLDEVNKADLDAGVIKKVKLYTTETEPLNLYYVLTLRQGTDLKETIKIYQRLPEVANVEINNVINAK